ncbi:MAG: hypothetical protein ACKVOQ_08050 [Cyclobacteriaceae bacterium]
MGQRYLIDSNVLIDYTSSRLPLKGSDFAEHIFNTDFLISVAVKIEVLENILGLKCVNPHDL